MVIIALHRLADMPSLIAVPLFTFAGYVLARANLQRLVALAEALVGWMPGGGGDRRPDRLRAVWRSRCFGRRSHALGGLIYPLLRKQGYPESFSLDL